MSWISDAWDHIQANPELKLAVMGNRNTFGALNRMAHTPLQPETPAWMSRIPRESQPVGPKWLPPVEPDRRALPETPPSYLNTVLSAADTAGAGYDGGEAAAAPEGTIGASFEHVAPKAISAAIHGVRSGIHGTRNEVGAMDPVNANVQALGGGSSSGGTENISYHPPAIVPGVNDLQTLQKLAALRSRQNPGAIAQQFHGRM